MARLRPETAELLRELQARFDAAHQAGLTSLPSHLENATQDYVIRRALVDFKEHLERSRSGRGISRVAPCESRSLSGGSVEQFQPAA
jgi:hypothetical protein